MREVKQLNQFRRDWKRQERRGKRMGKIESLVKMLAQDGVVESRNRPHKLAGEWIGWWECHIEPNWLLIYAVTDDTVVLARTGTHADLFK